MQIMQDDDRDIMPPRLKRNFNDPEEIIRSFRVQMGLKKEIDTDWTQAKLCKYFSPEANCIVPHNYEVFAHEMSCL